MVQLFLLVFRKARDLPPGCLVDWLCSSHCTSCLHLRTSDTWSAQLGGALVISALLSGSFGSGTRVLVWLGQANYRVKLGKQNKFVASLKQDEHMHGWQTVDHNVHTLLLWKGSCYLLLWFQCRTCQLRFTRRFLARFSSTIDRMGIYVHSNGCKGSACKSRCFLNLVTCARLRARARRVSWCLWGCLYVVVLSPCCAHCFRASRVAHPTFWVWSICQIAFLYQTLNALNWESRNKLLISLLKSIMFWIGMIGFLFPRVMAELLILQAPMQRQTTFCSRKMPCHTLDWRKEIYHFSEGKKSTTCFKSIHFLAIYRLGYPPPRIWKKGILQEISLGIPKNLRSYSTRQISFVRGQKVLRARPGTPIILSAILPLFKLIPGFRPLFSGNASANLGDWGTHEHSFDRWVSLAFNFQLSGKPYIIEHQNFLGKEPFLMSTPPCLQAVHLLETVLLCLSSWGQLVRFGKRWTLVATVLAPLRPEGGESLTQAFVAVRKFCAD